MSQVLRTLSQLLGMKRAMLTADDLATLPNEVRRLLLDQKVLAASRPATHVTCDACHDDHVEEVVRIKDVNGVVTFRIPCRDAGWVEVSGERLRQWTLDTRRLAAVLSAAIGPKSSPEEVVPGIAWRIGAVEIAGETYEIVFVRNGGTADETLFAKLGQRLPPARIIVVGIDVAPKGAGIAASLSLESAFAFGDDGLEFQTDRVRSVVSTQSIVAGNVFQLRGDKWQLSYGGETKYLKDSVGLHYIARLLREPRRIIPVPILHEMVTGVPAGVLKGTSEPFFTTEAFQNCRDRLEQLREDRIKAEQHGDSSWLARIDKEVEQIEIELGYNLGLNNSIRERSEYIKVKRKIAEYIRRGETAVSKRHSSLGLHLHNTIKKKGGFRYEPEQDLDWVT